MDFLTFALSLSGFIYLAFSLFFAVVAATFHNRLETPWPVAVALGFVFQLVGLGALIFVQYLRSAKRANEGAVVLAPPDPFLGQPASHLDPFSAGPSSFEQAFQADHSARWQPPSLAVWLVGAGALVLALPSVFLNWFYSITESRDELEVGFFSSGLEIWMFLTLASLVVAVALAGTKVTFLGPVALGYFGAWWFALSTAAITSRFDFISGMSAVLQLPQLVVSVNSQQVVSQQIGEGWLFMLPAGAAMLALAFILAFDHASRDSKAVY